VNFVSSVLVPSDILYEFKFGFCAFDVFFRQEGAPRRLVG